MSTSSPYRRLRKHVRSPLAWLVVFLVGLGCYRLTLIDKGHFYWSDERCYLAAWELVDAMSRGDAGDAVRNLFEARGNIPPARPGFVLVSVVPVLAQRVVASLAGISRELPHYYDTASAFNVLVTLGVTVCVYALGCTWTGQRWLGLLIAVVYSLLCGANVWIRHLMPYPVSLLFFLSALWLLSAVPRLDKNYFRHVMAAGLLTALGYACYPGYYAFVLVNLAVVSANPRRRVVGVAAFSLVSAAAIGTFELLARSVGGSYLKDLASLSGSVTVGDRKEGYVFAWRYLRDVEGVAGILLLMLFLAFVALLLRGRKVKLPGAARVAMLAAVGCYLFHASMGFWFGKMVFYGRLLGMYLPFVAGGAVLALTRIHKVAPRRIAVGVLLAASGWSFAVFAWQYSRIVYPAEFLQDTMTGLGRDIAYPANVLWGLVDGKMHETVERFDTELVNVADPRPDGCDVYVLLGSHEVVREGGKRFIGVNLKYMWYVRDRYDRFALPDGYALATEALHSEVFPATAYDGRKPWERKRISKRGYTMRIYERVDSRKRLTSLSVQ